jgi:hypothetical protein
MAKQKADMEEASEPSGTDAEELQENFNDEYSQVSDEMAKNLREADKERGPPPQPSKM